MKLFHQIRAASHGAAEGFFAPPSGNFRVVAGEQYFRDIPIAIFCRFRVLRAFQKRLGKGIARRACRITQDARHHTRHGVNHDHRAQLAARQDVIADGNELVSQMVFDASIHAFVMTAKKDDVIVIAIQRFRFFLREGHTGG